MDEVNQVYEAAPVADGGLNRLPEGLSAPEDDGGADHLVAGTPLTSVLLPSTAREAIDLSALTGRTVVYCYPMTGRPDRALPEGWDDIPGARGCTPQSCAFRDRHAELRDSGVRVFGVSTQSTGYQREAAERLGLPYELLSDKDLALTRTLSLPTFEAGGMVLLRRLTFVARGGLIEKVFYPVFPPDENPAEVIYWLSHNPDIMGREGS